MKPLQRYIKGLLGLWLLTLGLTAGRAQSFEQEANSVVREKPYEVGAYMGANRTINLMVVVRRAPAVTIRIRNADDEILHELYPKKSRRPYQYRLNFENTQVGQYKLEITDGRTSQTRLIEVVDVPATEAQRYITFTSPSNR